MLFLHLLTLEVLTPYYDIKNVLFSCKVFNDKQKTEPNGNLFALFDEIIHMNSRTAEVLI